MTRDELIEVMARAYCADGGFNPDDADAQTTWRWRRYVPPMRAALAAAEAAGFVLVPKVATDAIEEAGLFAASAHRDSYGRDFIRNAYAAMIAASAWPERDVGDGPVAQGGSFE